mmetsp:Transcript_2842/g.5325  ORF Transcript_2842/g.5325 Transcript_2842/m.5325 type:complete len:124 (-) Transcript_2842:1149-1520(-)
MNAGYRTLHSSLYRAKATPSSAKMLSTKTADAIHKLRSAVENYRIQNFSEELPSRCKKEIIQAADTESHRSGRITMTGLEKILKNIGASQQITKEDIKNIINELGESSNSEQSIPIEKMLHIL